MIRKILYISILVAISVFYFLRSQKNEAFLFGFALHGYPITDSMLTDIDNETAFSPDIIEFYLQWQNTSLKNAFPYESIQTIRNNGAISCITWEPMQITKDGQESTILAEDILKGTYDAYITSFALAAQKCKIPLLIRLGHEMNLDRYHWAVDKSEYNEQAPQLYIAMYRYIVEIFRKHNVFNALFVFCPNCDSIPSTPWNIMQNYYPGDEYVDICGLDGYRWETAPDKEISVNTVFGRGIRDLQTTAPHKPILIFETASPRDKRHWLKDLISFSRKNDIKGVIWFQVNKERDWKITQNDVNGLVFEQPLKAEKWAFDIIEKKQKNCITHAHTLSD